VLGLINYVVKLHESRLVNYIQGYSGFVEILTPPLYLCCRWSDPKTVLGGDRQYWGALQKTVRFETYLPVGTFPRGWYVSLVCHVSRAP